MIEQKTVLRTLIDAQVKHRGDSSLIELGKKMFNMFTRDGFPPDMFLEELKKMRDFSQSELIFIISQYQTHFLEHKRLSGIQEAKVDAIRRRNREDLERFITTGEIGVY